jgi:hypothetical protein
MRFIGLPGGRLMRAAICGLLAATVLPAAASADGIVGGSAAPLPEVSLPRVSTQIRATTRPARAKTHRGRQGKGQTNRRERTSTRSLMATSTTTMRFPFGGPITNTCTGEEILVNGTMTTVTQSQDDGTQATFISIGGSGITATLVRYGISSETHDAILTMPFEPLRTYIYSKMNRQGDTGVLLPGDDFWLRVYIEFVPGTSGGGPSSNSLMSMTGECR